MSKKCLHLESIKKVIPSARGREDCLNIGSD